MNNLITFVCHYTPNTERLQIIEGQEKDIGGRFEVIKKHDANESQEFKAKLKRCSHRNARIFPT